MIFDTLPYSHLYLGLDERLGMAFDFLQHPDLTGLPDGRIELQGQALIAILQRYTTKPRSQGLWEAHRRYMDLQYLVSGREAIGIAPVSQLEAGEYQPERDFLPLVGSGQEVTLDPGSFTIFYPQDAHMPGLAVREPEPVFKVVVKIQMRD